MTTTEDQRSGGHGVISVRVSRQYVKHRGRKLEVILVYNNSGVTQTNTLWQHPGHFKWE